MDKQFETLLHLPYSGGERDWLRQRLETLSAKESIILTAVLSGHTPETAAEAVNLLLDIPNHEVYCPVSGYEDLGRRYFAGQFSGLPEGVEMFTDMADLGRLLGRDKPGLFAGECYVIFPQHGLTERYDGHNLDTLESGSPVLVRLASQARPEGVWIALPEDMSQQDGSVSGEIELALRTLEVKRAEECGVLEIRCRVAEVAAVLDFAKIPEQYGNAGELLDDAVNLALMLDEHGQGMEDFERKLAAALEYDNCRTLPEALETGSSIYEYEIVSAGAVRDFAEKALEKNGISPKIRSAMDLEGYGKWLLDERGYRPARGGSVFVRRNSRSAPRPCVHEKIPKKPKKRAPSR